ncbi:N-acetyltransferase [Gordonia sp. HY002]|uniref:N-acetyltransferase n=1 Tax=Gordonia zhenghanii TaxID=2911516 RepID=UPI001EF0AC6C|nr:N-acetyltransferase [Gordonia zhenghanii]MCF8571307.1 N-acetyltransferase [Gordonia zhenghanii]MCF8601831.1 N-acetyltransferase [Gordonia zhenghanii]
MIRYEWCSELAGQDAQQLRDLLVRAAAYDAEPEYNVIDPDEVAHDMAADNGVRHLVVWLAARPVSLDGPDEPERVAGVIRLVPSGDGWADGTIVIDPDLRSIGIVTLLLEREGVEGSAPGGWLGSGFAGVRSWARGNHPASGRISDRNLLPRTRLVWKLVRPSIESSDGDSQRAEELTSADTSAIEGLFADLDVSAGERDRLLAAVGSAGHHVLGVGDDSGLVGAARLDLAPVFVDEIGRCGNIDCLATASSLDEARRRNVLTALLPAAGARAAAVGLDGVICYAPSSDDVLVSVSRRTGFQHDRTDVQYEIH